MDKENILRKIKSCLNMANSTNENEAIIALRQAQKLMRQHNITQDDVSFSEITEAETSTKSSIKKAWVINLLSIIEKSFIVYSCIDNKNKKVFFYGHSLNAELAEYAFDTLYQQILFSRKNYINKYLRRFKRINKILRGDLYALGWVSNVQNAINDFLKDEDINEINRIKALVKSQSNIVTITIPEQKIPDRRDIIAGRRDGDSTTLFRAMNTHEKKRLH